MNRINQLFEEKPNNICSIFLTAGFPNLEDTVSTVLELEKNGTDLVEIGMPFSDPLADGETIQSSSLIALKNGMTIDLLFQQVVSIRTQSQIPIVLMGYFNPVYNYGLEKFLQKCELSGVDGLIIPDISIEEYELSFKEVFERYQVPLTFLTTPRTAPERLKKIIKHSTTFIYYVSSASTTGKTGAFSNEQIKQFEKMKNLSIDLPILMGFGIHDHTTFKIACEYFNGGIIGSAFIRALKEKVEIKEFMGRLN
ncbi:MAG: tryptophan synthase subunit alpha [Crocinitomicaceae bacterium]